MMARFGFLFWLTSASLVANDLPVTILKGPVSGHIHPSICQTPDGALVMVCKGGGGLLRSRSIDGGKTWGKPALIAATAKRPKARPPTSAPPGGQVRLLPTPSQ